VINAYGQKQGASEVPESILRSNFQCLEGDARWAYSDETRWANRIFNVSMGTLDGPILMRRDGARQLDCVPYLSEQVEDFLAATKLPSKIHRSIFIIDRAGALGGKQLGEPLDGWRPGAKSSVVKRNGYTRVYNTV
jgi:hypothetical protein